MLLIGPANFCFPEYFFQRPILFCEQDANKRMMKTKD